MKSQAINQAISFCALTPDTSHHVQLILSTPGPSLEHLNHHFNTQPDTRKLRCTNLIAQISEKEEKQIIFGGSGKQSFRRSISFILLALAYKQVNNYPHLLTLIRQQFFKPGVFVEFDPKKCKNILNVCNNLEIQLISSETVTNFCQNNQEFMSGFQHILIKIIGQSDNNNYLTAIEIIKKKFQIDCSKVFTESSEVQCWAFGLQKRIYLFHQGQYLVIVSTCTKAKQIDMLDSNTEMRLQSERQFSDIGQQVIPEASEESTPKFKENQQSIRYRKKSHKDSFGGEFEISTYNQLGNLRNRSQVGKNNIQQSNEKKVFSVKFDINEIRNLQMNTSENNWFNTENEKIKNQELAQGHNIAKDQVQMRGSNIEGNQGRLKQNEEKSDRRKYLTSSQMHQMPKGFVGIQKLEDNESRQKNTNQNTNSNSNAQSGQQEVKVSQGTDKVSPTYFPFAGLETPKLKEDFKFSFSKKDSSRFVFKEIQSEYNEDNAPQHCFQNIEKSNAPQLMRSSLTNFKSTNLNSVGLLLQGEFFKKKQNNRKSLLIEAAMSPIKEQVQSSQQQSASQSVRDQQRDVQQAALDQILLVSSPHSKQRYKQRKNQKAENINNNFKNYINIVKSKNRKFSYLTQQVSAHQNNSIIGANEDRQKQIQENYEGSVANSPFSPKNYYQNNGGFKNRKQNSRNIVNRPAKIHKNSEAITNKKRFEENPISFSQMIANVSQPEESHFSGFSFPKEKKQPKLSLASNVSEFSQKPNFGFVEPEGWVRKQVVYYFEQQTQSPSSGPRAAEKYVFDKNTNLRRNNSSFRNEKGSGENLTDEKSSKNEKKSIPSSQQIYRPVQIQQKGVAYQKGFLEYLERLGSPQNNNIRLTISTSNNGSNNNSYASNLATKHVLKQPKKLHSLNILNPESAKVQSPSFPNNQNSFFSTQQYIKKPQSIQYPYQNLSHIQKNANYHPQYSPKFIHFGGHTNRNSTNNTQHMFGYNNGYVVQQHDNRSLSPTSIVYSENRNNRHYHTSVSPFRNTSYSTSNLIIEPKLVSPVNRNNIQIQKNINLQHNFSHVNLNSHQFVRHY